MGTVTSLPKRGGAWVLEELAKNVEKKYRILGFAFGDGPAGGIMPDELRLTDLLMARAILDITIHKMMITTAQE
jgi:hypothetical protein